MTKSTIFELAGTTGKPKGCIIEHLSAVNFVLSEAVFLKVTAKDIIFQTYSLAFDSSISTIWLAFFNGATLYVPTEDMMHSGNELAQYIDKANITVLDCVPSLLTMMTIGLSEEEQQNSSSLLPNVKIIIVGGEPCSRDIIKKWTLGGKRRIVNSYGPTEATGNLSIDQLSDLQHSPFNLNFLYRPSSFCYFFRMQYRTANYYNRHSSA